MTVLQLASRITDAGIIVQEATRGFSSSIINMSQGVVRQVIGSFTTLSQSAATLDFRHGDFSALSSSVHTLAFPVEAYAFLDAVPAPAGRRLSSGSPDLVTLAIPAGTPTFVLPISYGNPFPPTWNTTVVASAGFGVEYQLDLPDGGQTTPRSERATIGVERVTTAGAIGPLVPLQTPPRFLTIDRASATGAPISNISTTPLISWTAPALGVPTSYALRISRLTAGPFGGTQRVRLYNLTVPGNVSSIRLPPGLLASSTSYFIRMTASAEPTPFDHARPFKGYGLPSASAQLLRAAFKTQ